MRQLKITKNLTDRSSTTVDQYLKEIGQIEMITPEQETEVSEKIKQGDKGAINELVNANLRFVVSVAKQYQNQGLSLSDLINEGNIGLIKAAELFDPSKGFKFISYAVWWIRQKIIASLSDNCNTVRIPISKTKELSQIDKAYEALTQKYERTPTIQEISNYTDLSPDKCSFKRPVAKGFKVSEDHNLLDIIPSKEFKETDYETDSLKRQLNLIMSENLEPKEQFIIRYYFGIGAEKKGLKDIAKMLNYTSERVRQLKNKGIDKLKKYKNLLIDFV